MLKKVANKTLVVFDGHCAMCDGMVTSLMQADKENNLVFCPNQDVRSVALLTNLGHLSDSNQSNRNIVDNGLSSPSTSPSSSSSLLVDARWFDEHKDTTIIVMDPEGLVTMESDAAISIGRKLPRGTLFHTAAIAASVTPRVVRNAVYRFVGRHRLSVFGRLDACRVPTVLERNKFI